MVLEQIELMITDEIQSTMYYVVYWLGEKRTICFPKVVLNQD